MVVFEGADRWQAFADEGWRRACVDSGFTSEDQCQIILACREMGEISVAEAIERLSSEPALAGVYRWVTSFLLEQLEEPQRLTLLGAADPSFACAIYCSQADLSDDEDAVLWGHFEAVMTFSVELLRADPMRRAKFSDG